MRVTERLGNCQRHPACWKAASLSRNLNAVAAVAQGSAQPWSTSIGQREPISIGQAELSNEAGELWTIVATRDDGESIGLFEPLLVSEGAKSRPRLDALAISLAEKSAALSASLPPAILSALADVVTVANCHYSNLIEGHDLHPVDIERALCNDFYDDAERRDLQIEAVAHVAAQNWIDDDKAAMPSLTVDRLCKVHKRFFDVMPLRMRLRGGDRNGEKLTVRPGTFRTVDVRVGRHIAVSPGAVPRFLARMEQAYGSAAQADLILATACAHHRLLWVHPFLDGNGRVARLLTHDGLKAAIDMRGLWSVSRGLAQSELEYRRHLQSCDELRRGSLDGRGSLSEGALADFAEFIITTCIREVEFMAALVEKDQLTLRVTNWAIGEVRAGTLAPESELILAALLIRGELSQSEMTHLAAFGSSSPERLTTALVNAGIARRGPGASLELSFSIPSAVQLFPGLLPPRRHE